MNCAFFIFAIPDCGEHGSQGQERGHGNANPGFHHRCRNEKGEPRDENEKYTREIGLDQVVT